jgi:hypothetical protein
VRLRSRRGDLLLPNLSAPAGKPRATRPVRARRLRYWLRTGALLSVIGIRRLALAARTRSQPIFLVTGALVLVIGLTMRSSVAVVLGMIVMGSAVSGTGSHSPTAAMVHTWMWLRKS